MLAQVDSKVSEINSVIDAAVRANNPSIVLSAMKQLL
jgi:hypothetical protein